MRPPVSVDTNISRPQSSHGISSPRSDTGTHTPRHGVPTLEDLISARQTVKAQTNPASKIPAHVPLYQSSFSTASHCHASSPKHALSPRTLSSSPSLSDANNKLSRPSSSAGIASPSRQNTADYQPYDQGKPSRQSTVDLDRKSSIPNGLSLSRQSSDSNFKNKNNQGTRYFRFDRKIYRIGLVKDNRYSVNYASILEGNWSELDRIFESNNYVTFPSTSLFSGRKRTSRKVIDAVSRELFQGMSSICREANKKRHKLHQICLQNPYLSNVTRIYGYVSVFFGNLISDDAFDGGYNRNVCLCTATFLSVGLLPILLALFWIFSIMLGSLLGLALDLLTVRCFCRYTQSELSWIRQTLSKHPDLDNTAIQDSIVDSFQSLAEEVMKKYPDVTIHVWKGLERKEQWNLFCDLSYSYKEEVMFIINPPSDVFGQVMHTI